MFEPEHKDIETLVQIKLSAIESNRYKNEF